jgi:protein phosphatase PTC7
MVTKMVILSSSLAGSSTACILSFNCNTGLLRAANLGDSGFLAMRHNTIIGRSSETIHYFNCPYQLSNPPPGYDSIARVISDR